MIALAVGCARESGAHDAALSTPSPAPIVAATPTEVDLADNAACLRCHPYEARTWSASRHRTAFVDEVFQAEWSPHAQAACVRCHAPRADAEAPEGEAAANGIDCVVCHVRDGTVLGLHAAPDAPHPIRVEPALATSEACADCHDFSFARVAPTPYDTSQPLQRTLREHAEVAERGPCGECHLRDGDRVTHAMPGARDPALLARALRVEASAAIDGSEVVVTLALSSEAGHAVPTGDMFRRLEVRAWSGREPPASVTLQRRFARVGAAIREVEDARVPPRGARTVTLRVPRARTVHWQILWLALDPELAARRWLADEDVRRVVAEGVVAVERGRARR